MYPTSTKILKEKYPMGTNVILTKADAYLPSVGSKGIVECVDDIATIHVKWEDGRTIGVLFGKGELRKEYPHECTTTNVQ